MDAIEVDGDMVQIVGPRQAKVKSRSQPELWYAVDAETGVCTCKGFQVRKECRHLDAVNSFIRGTAAVAGMGDITEVKLATSRYQNADLVKESKGVPVGITVGNPRFKLGYKLACIAKEFAPVDIPRDIPSDEEFERLYRARLELFGLDRLKRRLSEIAVANDNAYLILLCYEDLTKPGEVCHRRMFAKWWQEQTGYIVWELGAPVPEKLA